MAAVARDKLYKTEATLKRTVRVCYPAGRGRIVLRTELDWDRNVEPVAAGNSFAPRQTVRAEVIDVRKTKSMARAAAAAPSLQRASAMVGSQLQSQLSMNGLKPASGAVTAVDGETITVEFDVPWTVHVGDQFDVLRAEEKLGTLVILSVSGKNASGKFTGTGVPRAGDIALGHKEKAERK